jgi:threonine dehydrogenase-like Zn-dependent dehydrogenase
MVRGRTAAPAGLILGHETAGEAIEAGRDVETLEKGDLVSVPFDLARGRCRVDAAARNGSLSIRLSLGWAESHSFFTGQAPVMKYNRALVQAILWDRIDTAGTVGVEVISLDDAPRGHQAFDPGAPRKYVIDPHGQLAAP